MLFPGHVSTGQTRVRHVCGFILQERSKCPSDRLTGTQYCSENFLFLHPNLHDHAQPSCSHYTVGMFPMGDGWRSRRTDAETFPQNVSTQLSQIQSTSAGCTAQEKANGASLQGVLKFFPFPSRMVLETCSFPIWRPLKPLFSMSSCESS